MWDSVKNMIKGVPWKKIGYDAWLEGIKPELEKMVEKTDNKWDDAAVQAVDYLVEKFLNPDVE
jgi:hypothetical protein